jgi:predicted transcriptional regulator
MATITISLPDGLVDNLDRIARHLGMSRSALVASRLQGTIRKDMVDLINSYVDDQTDEDHDLTADVVAISRRSISGSS